MATGGGNGLLTAALVIGGGYLLYRSGVLGSVLPAATPAPTPLPSPIPAAPAITTAPPLLQPATPVAAPKPTAGQALSTDPSAFLNSVYQSALGRPSDPAGEGYWLGIIAADQAAGKSDDQIATEIQSDFYTAKASGAA